MMKHSKWSVVLCRSVKGNDHFFPVSIAMDRIIYVPLDVWSELENCVNDKSGYQFSEKS